MSNKVFEERLARIAALHGTTEEIDSQSLASTRCAEGPSWPFAPVIFLFLALFTGASMLLIANSGQGFSTGIHNATHISTGFFSNEKGVELKRSVGSKWSKVSELGSGGLFGTGTQRFKTGGGNGKKKFVDLMQLEMERKALSDQVKQGNFGFEGTRQATRKKDKDFWNSF